MTHVDSLKAIRNYAGGISNDSQALAVMIRAHIKALWTISATIDLHKQEKPREIGFYLLPTEKAGNDPTSIQDSWPAPL